MGRRSALTKEEWADVRAEREAGATFSVLAEKYKVDRAAIWRKAKNEEWGDGSNLGDAYRDRVNAKVHNVAHVSPAKKAAAIDAAAERAAEIVRRHQEEPGAVRAMLYGGIKRHKEAENIESKRLAFEDLKAAKISSEVLLNLHRMERIAWGLDSPETPKGDSPRVICYLPSNGR